MRRLPITCALHDALKMKGMTLYELERATGFSFDRILKMDQEVLGSLERVLGIPANFWLHLERSHPAPPSTVRYGYHDFLDQVAEYER